MHIQHKEHHQCNRLSPHVGSGRHVHSVLQHIGTVEACRLIVRHAGGGAVNRDAITKSKTKESTCHS